MVSLIIQINGIVAKTLSRQKNIASPPQPIGKVDTI